MDDCADVLAVSEVTGNGTILRVKNTQHFYTQSIKV